MSIIAKNNPAQSIKKDFFQDEILLEDEEEFYWEGKEVDGCSIEECVGFGASGDVYRGTYRQQEVAIKIFKDDEGMLDEEQYLRFCREARLLQKVKHPAVIEFLNMGHTEDRHPYIIMEYFPADTLENVLMKKRRLAACEVVDIIKQVGKGMDAVHAMGLIHRDLKPSNILYGKGGKIKVIDFGIAREIVISQEITQPGHIVGSPAYMSPEQCREKPLDHRSDIYSLGAVFYQMLTGRLLFCKPTTLQTLLAHVSESIRWPSFPAVPLPVQMVVEKMLAKAPEDRYPSMANMLCELNGIKCIN